VSCPSTKQWNDAVEVPLQLQEQERTVMKDLRQTTDQKIRALEQSPIQLAQLLIEAETISPA
jgi:hypothetical protein